MLEFQKSIYIFIYLICVTESFRINRPKRKLKSQYLYENPTTKRIKESTTISEAAKSDLTSATNDWRIYRDRDFTYSNERLPSVCKSTGYYKDFLWVPIKQRKVVIKTHRPYLKDLRDIMYENADVEACHQPEMLNVLQFLECQVRRHMRLELEVPNYPAVPN